MTLMQSKNKKLRGTMKYLLIFVLLTTFAGCASIEYSSMSKNGTHKKIEYVTLLKDIGSPNAKIGNDHFTAIGSDMSIDAATMTDIIVSLITKKYNIPDIPEIELPREQPAPEAPQPPPIDSQPEVEPPGNKLSLRYYRETNGGRPTYYTYTYRQMNVGDDVRVVVGNRSWEFRAKKRANGSIGHDEPTGFVAKNSEVRGRGIAVLLPTNFSGGTNPAYIVFE